MSMLDASFYQQNDVVQIARDLLGKVIVTKFEGQYTTAMITETEAYKGADDRACHAYGYKKTTRTETMFMAGGHAYIYLCYGIHELFNVVCNIELEPDAVLIRAVAPLEGIELQLKKIEKAKKTNPKPGLDQAR